MLGRAVTGQFDEADLDIVALDHAFGDCRAFGVHRLPAGCGQEAGQILIGRVRHVQNGAFGVDRRASRIHVTPGLLLLSELLFDELDRPAMTNSR
ncbi:UNVERIFIED_ORG: hypothetical protein J2Y81_007634 [Paraburkholderia sediminicola]|nr:hypothetical protein [Paraburkholderia sediminicola]